MSAKTITINMLAERLSELEDRMDSLMDTTKPTGFSDRLLTFSEALEAMKSGRQIRRWAWSAGGYLCAGHNGIVTVESVLANDWIVVGG